MKIIYEDEEIVVKQSKKDFDFIAVIENKTEEIIAIIADDETDEETGFESFDIAPFDWVGILANEEGRQILRAIRLGKFSTNFNPDYVI